MSDSSQNKDQVTLEDFAYKAIHDLKAPIRGIDSFMKLLDKKNKENWDEKDEKYISFVFKSASKMQNLVQDLLNFMKVTLHEHAIEELNLQDLVEEVYDMLPNKGDKVSFTCSNLPKINGQRLIYQLLFSNLIDNAVTYVEPDAEVTVEITCKELDNNFVYSISDNGIGIESGDFEAIFKPLERLHSDSTYPGTGLGLAICKRITDYLGGTISVSSTFGEGSTFEVTIPKS